MTSPKKSLGQHWLRDRDILREIADEAELSRDDTVLEIGPGLGTLTSELLRQCWQVIAVEFDEELARKLPGQFPGTNLRVEQGDILTYELASLPKGYKVVANIPYYITSKIIQLLMTASNKPSRVVLLVQREVAERLAAKPGDMSILAVSAQSYADVTLGPVVFASSFTPPPKVDSRVVVLQVRPEPLVPDIMVREFFAVVKAGFSAKRKKLRSSLSGGLAISKEQAELWLREADLNPDTRAESLSVEDWKRLTEVIRDST